MDRSVRPGEDFFDYANGGWTKAAEIAPDESINDAFSRLEERSQQRARAILEEAARTPGSKIGDFYASFMDRARVNALGVAPLAPLLDRIQSARDRNDVADILAELMRDGVSLPFDAFVDADDKDPERNALVFAQDGLGLPDRDQYLDADPGAADKRNAYRNYLVQLLKLARRSDANARADKVIDFETRLAKLQLPLVDQQDVDLRYNPMTGAQLKAASPAFPWDRLLDGLGVANEHRFILRQPSAVEKSARMFAEEPLPVVQDYLALRALDAFAPELSKPFVDAHFVFHNKTLEGASENTADWKRATDLVSLAMGEEVGRLWVERYFPSRAKAEADRLVQNVLAAWDRHLQGLTWMSPATRKKARAKLAALKPEIGYPARWRDYRALEVRRDDLLGNAIRANRFEFQRQIDKLGHPVDRGEWYTIMPPMAVNGYANHQTNQVVFSAGVLQPPFFDTDADAAINYGGIGAVIAHEIGHQFDQQGSRYDEHGRLSDWWAPGDVKRFNALTAKLADQYSRYEPLPGKHIDGKLTLAENIADLAGVTVAYDAYRASRKGQPAPVRDGLTGDQRFFLGWAQIWRGVFRLPVRELRLATDIHSPVAQRVATVRNLDSWYRAYEVRPGERLYLAPANRVRIW